MGTSGLFGFYYKGKFYMAYNHFDSSPDWLGASLVKQIREALDNGESKKWPDKLQEIKVVESLSTPTEEDISKLKPYTDMRISVGWASLLGKTQGSLANMLDAGYLENCVNDDGTPQWLEYNYVIDLDNNSFDWYSGSSFMESFPFEALPEW